MGDTGPGTAWDEEVGVGGKHCRTHTWTAEFQTCEETKYVSKEMEEGERHRAARPLKRCPVLWDKVRG